MATMLHTRACARLMASSGRFGPAPTPLLYRPAVAAVARRERRNVARWLSRTSSTSQKIPLPPVSVIYKHVLLVILDSNPYLNGGSQQALATAAAMSRQHEDAHVTVLVVDEPQAAANSTKLKMETVTWHLKDQNSARYEVLEASRDSSSAALIGDMVDQINADVLVLSSEAVHAKAVDANLLTEFVSCPVLLLP